MSSIGRLIAVEPEVLRLLDLNCWGISEWFLPLFQFALLLRCIMGPPAEILQQSQHRVCCTFTRLGAATLNCVVLKVALCCTAREEAIYMVASDVTAKLCYADEF
jgi:hypothetical protein